MTCKMCGRCCRVSVVTVPASDWDESLEEFLILKGKHYLDTIDNQRRYVYWAPCPHLDLITDKCKIHGHKPAACKRYPDDQMTLLPGCGYAGER